MGNRDLLDIRHTRDAAGLLTGLGKDREEVKKRFIALKNLSRSMAEGVSKKKQDRALGQLKELQQRVLGLNNSSNGEDADAILKQQQQSSGSGDSMAQMLRKAKTFS